MLFLNAEVLVSNNKNLKSARVERDTPIYLNLHSKEEFTILNKGLNFAIPDKDSRFIKLNEEGANRYLTRVNNSFLRSMAQTIESEPMEKDAALKYLKLKKLIPDKIIKPSKAPPHFNIIFEIIKKINQRQIKWSNLTTTHLKEFTKLKNDKELVLTKMDKSAGFVLLKKTEYIKMGEKLFNDQESFNIMEKEFKPATKLNQIRHLNNNIFRHLLSTHSVTQKMFELSQVPCLNFSFTYLLIKNHKELGDDKLYPVRPIVSANNTTFKFLDRYLELILYPLLSLIPSKIRNNMHLINKLKGIPFSENSQLASLDVSDMYPSIDQFQAASTLEIAVKENIDILKEHVKDFKINLPAPNYIKFLALVVMRNNIFSFNKRFFQSKKGIAMGSNISVLLAEIFIWKSIEIKLNLHHLNISLWARFIDDIFILTHDINFNPLTVINVLHNLSSLKFTSEGPNKKINFLDIQIENVNGQLIYSPYEKPTNTHAFLDFHSNHPLQVKKAIIISKLHRIKQLSASNFIFQQAKSKFKSELINRNYPLPFIDSQFARMNYNIKIGTQTKRKALKGIPLVLPFLQSKHDSTMKYVKQFKILIRKNYEGANFIESLMPRLIFKKSQTLSNILFKGRNCISKTY